jgi:DNA-binding IclR family transcriptional regulator
LGVNELARIVGLDKSSVSRILHSLLAAGLVARDGPGQPYRLGMGIVALAQVALNSIDVRSAAAPVVQEISANTGETSHFAIWDRDCAVIIEHAPGDHPVRAMGAVGETMPAHCMSLGKVLLAHQPGDVIDRVLAGTLTRYTQATITDPGQLRAELAAVRETGVGYNHGEHWQDLVGVAAPVRDHEGLVVGVISVSGPSYRLTQQKLPLLARLVKDAASKISARLGAMPQAVAVVADSERQRA